MSSALQPPSSFRGAFRTDDAARAVYAEAAGIGRVMPRAVAVPDSPDDVAALVRWASEKGQSIVARGSGSSMAGGAIGDGVVVDVSRLRALGAVDVDGRCLLAAAGVLRADVERRAAESGLRFPVDPSSGAFCTIGGMAATNAAGPHSLRHGSMRPWVLALECVFADGSRATVRRGADPPLHIAAVRRFMQAVHPELLLREDSSVDDVLKNSSGYAIDVYRQTHELVDLLVGSEGTLALFTAVEVALMPAPGGAASLFVAFRDLEQAVDAAVASRQQSSVAACELLDRTFLTLASEAGRPLPAPPDSEAALLLDLEETSASRAMEAAVSLGDRFRSMGGRASEMIVSPGSSHDAELWALRHAASPAIAKLDPALRSMQFIEDAAVPPRSLAAYVRGVRTILSRYDTRGVIFGHAGDAHVHVNPLVDTRRTDWRERVEGILVAVTDLVAHLGGTLSGEHGDGRLRTPLLDRIWRPDELRLFGAIKDAFDPSNILNPGVKVALGGQRAVDVIKYDPQLAAHPASAAAALATVERERAYDRHRLDLL